VTGIVFEVVAAVLTGLDETRVAALRAEGRFFWLDVSLTDTSHDALRTALDVPDRALDPAHAVVADGRCVAFALRCYVEPQRPQPVKIDIVITGEYLLTLHEERLALPSVLDLDPPEDRGRDYLVYSVLDTMLARTFSALEEVGESLDALAASWTDEHGGGVPRATLRRTVATLASMRRWVTAEQAAFERVGVEIAALPGFGSGQEPYFDRLNEQVDRLLGSIDAAANGLGMLLDLQLNERAYIVSVVATIFVPLTLVTGYFGMNFGWLVDHIDSTVAFLLLGVLIPIAAGVLSWRLLVRGGLRR
jgi:magnesium transporter